MPQAFQYWRPGSEERKLRVFISHRHGDDEALYDGVVDALSRNGFPVQDISLSAQQVMRGPRGGKLPKLEVQANIAARIYTADVLIAPSRPAAFRSDWVTWEVHLAAIGYGIPVLFVNKRGHKRRTKLVSDIAELGLPFRDCDPDAEFIARSVADLVDPRPKRAMRLEESDASLKFRGPTPAAIEDVLTKHPFRPRLGGTA